MSNRLYEREQFCSKKRKWWYNFSLFFYYCHSMEDVHQVLTRILLEFSPEEPLSTSIIFDFLVSVCKPELRLMAKEVYLVRQQNNLTTKMIFFIFCLFIYLFIYLFFFFYLKSTFCENFIIRHCQRQVLYGRYTFQNIIKIQNLY